MKRTGRKKSVVYEVLAGKQMKYGGPADAYLKAAVDAVREALANSGIKPPRHPYGALYKGRPTGVGKCDL